MPWKLPQHPSFSTLLFAKLKKCRTSWATGPTWLEGHNLNVTAFDWTSIKEPNKNTNKNTYKRSTFFELELIRSIFYFSPHAPHFTHLNSKDFSFCHKARVGHLWCHSGPIFLVSWDVNPKSTASKAPPLACWLVPWIQLLVERETFFGGVPWCAMHNMLGTTLWGLVVNAACAYINMWIYHIYIYQLTSPCFPSSLFFESQLAARSHEDTT